MICREVTSLKAGAQAVSCKPMQRAKVQPGASHTETVPLDVSGGMPTLLTYRVELQNDRGHSAGVSAPAFVAGGEGPAAIGSLAVEARREGTLVTWAKTSRPAQVRLVRTQLSPLPQARKPDQKAQPLNFSGSTSQPAVANIETPGQLASDPGGVIDPTAQNGYTYRYVAERVVTVTLGGHLLEMHGAPSSPTTLTYRDIFPPRSPAGLVSVPGGGFGQPSSIDLSWDANLETDLLGYNVYRKDAAGGDFIRLNPEPIPASAFRDLTAQPGHSYVYRLTAIDQRHSESPPGDEIHETLRQ